MTSLGFFLLIAALFAISLLFKSFFTVEQQTGAIVERFGKYVRTALPGLNMKIPFVEKIRGHVSLRVQQLDVPVETKTEDNVFVKVAVSVQYHVIENKMFEAFYKLDNPEQQMTAFVFDVVRARVPKMKLDDVFEKKDEIADAVKIELSELISNLGFNIVKTLVTDIDPAERVKKAMNEINEAQRLRIAANERGEAEKILKIKKAEAEAESSALQGKGLADQRRAIIEGLQVSIEDFQKAIAGTNSQNVMNLVLMTQYFETLKEIGTSGLSNTIMLPHSPGGMNELMDQIRNAIITGNEASHPTVKTHQAVEMAD